MAKKKVCKSKKCCSKKVLSKEPLVYIEPIVPKETFFSRVLKFFGLGK